MNRNFFTSSDIPIYKEHVMTASLSHHRSALAAAHLLFLAALLASVSTAWADNITYYLVDHPALQTDIYQPFTDSISGYIVTDGVMGPLTSSDFVTGTLTLTTPLGQFTGTLTSWEFFYCNATPSYLLLPWDLGNTGDKILLYTTGPPTNPGSYMSISWGQGYLWSAFTYAAGSGVAYPPDNWTGFRTVPGADGVPYWPDNFNNSYIIATSQSVPEPSTITLLCSALLALGWRVVFVRHRKA